MSPKSRSRRGQAQRSPVRRVVRPRPQAAEPPPVEPEPDAPAPPSSLASLASLVRASRASLGSLASLVRAAPPWLVRAADVALRVAGFVVALAGAFLVSVYGAFLTPFRIGTTLVPISLVIAIVGNIAVIWFAYVVTRNRLLAIIPGAVWLALSFLASSKTAAGDLLLISSDWVASAYLVAGPIAIAYCAYRLFLRHR